MPRLGRVVPWDEIELDQRFGGGRASMPGMAPSAPPPSEQLRPVAAIPPFYYVKPPSGQDFYFNVEPVVLAAGAGSNVVIAPAAPLAIFPLYKGVVAFVTIFLDAPTNATSVNFTLRFNGGPVQGADALRSFPRTANNLSVTFPFNIVVPGGTVIDVLATNQNASGPWTVSAEVGGWQYPESLERRIFGDESY